MSRTPSVVVVGGGIIGCACAYELAGRGAEVTLIERSTLAAGASGRNHGLLLAPLDPDLVPMASASTALYEEAIPRSPLPVHLDRGPIGLLIVATAEAERDAARREADAAAACGVAVERVDGGRLRDVEPGLADGFREGWLLRDGRRLDPGQLTSALALLARDRGATVRRHLPVRGFLGDGRRVTGVVTEEGAIPAQTVILAAGPWTASLARLLGMTVPVAGARGWLVHLAPGPFAPLRLVGRAGWHAPPGEEATPPATALDLAGGTLDAFVSSMIQPNPDGTILLGGSRQWAVAHEPEDTAVPGEIVRQAVRLMPALSGAALLSAWWGVRPMTPDGRPIVDMVMPGLLVATGHGSQGVILGGGTARLVASMVLGEAPPFDPAPFSVVRFPGGDHAPVPW